MNEESTPQTAVNENADLVQAYRIIEERRRQREMAAAEEYEDMVRRLCKRYNVKMEIIFIARASGNTFQVSFTAAN